MNVNVFSVIFSGLWGLTYFFIAFVSFSRFRNTASGTIMGISCTFLGVKIFAMLLLRFSGLANEGIANWSMISYGLTLLFYLFFIIGVAMIPASLKELSRQESGLS